MKISTIQALLDNHLITLEECDKSEKDTNENVVKKTEDGKYYKVKETEEELKMDLLVKISTDITTIKTIILFCLISFIIIIIVFFIVSSL